jgi:glycosyltransferase involved in cell wall biosynthesis
VTVDDSSKCQNITVVLRELTPYWVEALDSLARAWSANGSITVISGALQGDDLHPWQEDAQPLKVAQLKVIPPLPRRRWGGTIWPPKALWRELERLDPALVIIQEYSPYVVLSGFIWAKAAGRPCVVTTDVGPMLRRQLKFPQRWAHDFVNWGVDGVLARTQDALDGARVAQRPCLLAPHAVATGFYATVRVGGHRPRRLIQVGSLIPRKGIDLLLRALVRVQSYCPEVELVLVGAGNHQQVRQEAERLGVSERVRIKDFLQPSELVREYQQSDLFVLASRFDSYGVVVHEAAAAGLPLVLSRHVGASATLVENGVNGFQIDPEDTEGFADALLQALEPKANAAMGRRSREMALKYDVAQVARRSASWLEQVMLLYEAAHPASGRTSPRATRWRGCARWVASVGEALLAQAGRWLYSDAFGMERREVVFVNRYIPFYREGIFRRVADWRTTKLLFSGKTLGNLRSVEGVDQESVPFLEWGRGEKRGIFWLGVTVRLWRTRPRVVCTEMALSLWSIWWWFVLRRWLGFGLVFWTHGFQEYRWKGETLGLADRIRLWWMGWADAVIFYSESRRKDVERLAGSQRHFFVAPNTLDTAVYEEQFGLLESEGREAVRRRLGVNRLTLLYVGRLTEEKDVLGLPHLLEATAGSSQAPDLVVIGGGEQEAALARALRAWPDRARMLGPIFDTPLRCAWVYAADLMVCTGYAGLNVVDSLAMGCPYGTVDDRTLIRRHSPEISYVEGGVNGWIASSREDLADAIRRWAGGEPLIQLSRPEIRQKFLAESSIERQFSGIKGGLEHAMKDRYERS